MEIFAGLAVALVALVLLAAVGVVTLAALPIMATLGLLNEWSFRRNFFVAFGIGLFAPFLLGGLLIGAIEDGSLQREFQDAIVIEGDFEDLDELLEAQPELRELLPPPDEMERVLEARPDLRERIPPEVLERLLERGVVIGDDTVVEEGAEALPGETGE